MMRIDIISVQPKMFEGFLAESIVARAVRKGACEINVVDLRDFGEGRWRKVDDKPYGGGPGMLMKCGPWFAAVESCVGTAPISPGTRIIMTSPAGRRFTQRDAEAFARLATDGSGDRVDQAVEAVRADEGDGGGEGQSGTPPVQSLDHSFPPPASPLPSSSLPSAGFLRQSNDQASPRLVFLCGHYEGFDARIETLATDRFSLGDFVMTGGELAAAAMVDSIVRLLPGVLGGGPAATASESFGRDRLLEAPQYTHPPEFRGMKVPEVLLSGDHARIEAWRSCEARRLTAERRPDLLEGR